MSGKRAGGQTSVRAIGGDQRDRWSERAREAGYAASRGRGVDTAPRWAQLPADGRTDGRTMRADGRASGPAVSLGRGLGSRLRPHMADRAWCRMSARSCRPNRTGGDRQPGVRRARSVRRSRAAGRTHSPLLSSVCGCTSPRAEAENLCRAGCGAGSERGGAHGHRHGHRHRHRHRHGRESGKRTG